LLNQFRFSPERGQARPDLAELAQSAQDHGGQIKRPPALPDCGRSKRPPGAQATLTAPSDGFARAIVRRTAKHFTRHIVFGPVAASGNPALLLSSIPLQNKPKRKLSVKSRRTRGGNS